jgi:hypothetical protein
MTTERLNLIGRRTLPSAALALTLLCGVQADPAPGGGRSGVSLQTRSKKAKSRPTRVVRVDSVVIRTAQDSLSAARQTADSLQRADSARAERLREDSTNAARLRVVRNEAFGTGERLIFDVNYGFVTAGEAVLAIKSIDTISSRPCYRVEFTVKSLPSFSWIYRVEDLYLTFIDEQTIAPWRFEQHIREGNFHKDFVAEFDQHRNVARAEGKEYAAPPYVHDILSAFYFVRTIDFSGKNAGDIITMSNFYSDTTYELGVKVLGRQDLDIEAGSFHTIVIEPLVKEGGLFKSEGRIVIWLTDDERKMPVRVNTKVIIGSIDTELRAYSGLRGPVPARYK